MAFRGLNKDIASDFYNVVVYIDVLPCSNSVNDVKGILEVVSTI